MFERYSEQGRRALFFARYEASQLGSASIGPEHLLLGLIRGARAPLTSVFDRAGVRREEIRTSVVRHTPPVDAPSSSRDIPFAPRRSGRCRTRPTRPIDSTRT